LYKLFIVVIDAAVGELLEELVGRVIGTYHNLSHCKGLSRSRADYICCAGVDEYFIAVGTYSDSSSINNTNHS
jgi:hypothetical protein